MNAPLRRHGPAGLRVLPGLRALAGLLALVALPAAVRAQIPEEFTNLKVLPEDIGRRELTGIMRGFAMGLGVRCTYCHVGEEGRPFSEYDFASDEKPQKRKARFMLEMVRYLNDERLPALSEVAERVDPPLRVECVTCHRGVAVPRQIGDVIAQAIDEDGVDAGIARYRELRDEYYGSGSYDFGTTPLVELGGELADGGETDAGLAVLSLALEYEPESVQALVGIARVHMARDETEEARAALLKAQAIEPDQPFIRRMLQQLEGGG